MTLAVLYNCGFETIWKPYCTVLHKQIQRYSNFLSTRGCFYFVGVWTSLYG